MPLYEVTEEGLERRPPAAFAACTSGPTCSACSLTTSPALDEDLIVIAEEFGNWEDARRRIDLLALDKAGRLVVIEAPLAEIRLVAAFLATLTPLPRKPRSESGSETRSVA